MTTQDTNNQQVDLDKAIDELALKLETLKTESTQVLKDSIALREDVESDVEKAFRE